MKIIFLLLLAVSFVGGCVEKEDMCCVIRETQPLDGVWLFFERGYSPGAGYITESVSSQPAQKLVLTDGKVSGTTEGWENLKFYRILNDTVYHSPYIAFYTTDPDSQPSNSPVATYSFDLEGDILTLRFRWCIEGCHMAFKKIGRN
ncbi:MAG TPA: hypothetical protein VEW65_03455 [Chryseolinea sp.]|nr:hypothetical protein [Chryseolinea sp.]